VHEEVFATVIRGDKAIAFIIVEPLDRSLGNVLELTFLSLGFLTTKRPPRLIEGWRFTVAIKTHLLLLSPQYTKSRRPEPLAGRPRRFLSYIVRPQNPIPPLRCRYIGERG
jgi:hypothetical protein